MSDKLVVNHFEQRLRWPVGGASDEAHNPDELTSVNDSGDKSDGNRFERCLQRPRRGEAHGWAE